MFDAQIKVDLQQFNRSLTDIERKQLPYAIMLTLNETAKGGRLEVQREMDRVFDSAHPLRKAWRRL